MQFLIEHLPSDVAAVVVEIVGHWDHGCGRFPIEESTGSNFLLEVCEKGFLD